MKSTGKNLKKTPNYRMLRNGQEFNHYQLKCFNIIKDFTMLLSKIKVADCRGEESQTITLDGSHKNIASNISEGGPLNLSIKILNKPRIIQ